jgi:hypothetical protein
MTAETVMDAAEAIQALEHALSRTPRAQRPHEHAAIAYRLGLAHAESPVGPPPANLRRALACYEVAADLFDPRFDPVEHARVLNAAGAAHRGLGDQGRAAALFEEASRLLTGRGRDDEQAAALPPCSTGVRPMPPVEAKPGWRRRWPTTSRPGR